jgi:two-component system, NarL family, sensor histidine kinase LiaS
MRFAMNQVFLLSKVRLLARQLKWRLTLTYLLVAVTAVLIAAWWAIIAVAIYLARDYAGLGWQEAVGGMILPALTGILPSAPLLILPAVLVSTYFGFLSARWLDARLTGLRQATNAWRQGDFSVRVGHESSTLETSDEIDRFGEELNEMAAELHALLQTRQELATLEERNRLARDLHDSVKQHLAAAALQIGAAEALLHTSPAAAGASLTEAADLTHLAQRELGSIIFELQPVSLRQQGLTEALRQYLAGWSRQFGIQAALELVGERPFSPEIEGALFRFAQEALSNVARHSGATAVTLSLRGDNETIHFTIADNGRGFDPSVTERRGLGLNNMRQRMTDLGGEATITTAPGQGVMLSARLPLQKQPSGD